MTVSQAIDQVDALAPNMLMHPEKSRHLAVLNERVLYELYQANRVTLPDLPDVSDPSADLLIPSPWDEGYVYYTAAMIEYARGDNARYNEHIGMFHSLWGAYADHFRRTHLPRGGFRY